MDLGAFSQIEDLESILNDNKIDIPRLRGLRLMKNEDPFSEEDIQGEIKETALCQIHFLTEEWNAHHNKKCLVYNKQGPYGYTSQFPVDINWSKVHGKDRKIYKKIFKDVEKICRANRTFFNQYCGKDVLYVHARQGGGNREYYPIDTKHPMYLADVDDPFDQTYCDIYYDLTKAVKKED